MASQEEKRDSVQLEEKESNKEQKHDDKEDSNERSNPLEYSSEEKDTVDGM